MTNGILTVRGSSVLSSPRDPAATQIVLLIHGYNNTEAIARESYRLLREKLAEAGANSVALDNTWEVYWPGFEARWVTLLSRDQEAVWYSVATYSQQVPKAASAGKHLGSYLSDLPTRPGIVLVAHSLGCRVALETLREMKIRGQGGRVVAFCLMAAAVPTYMADQNGSLRAAAELGVSTILWSPWDFVLRFAFPLGQAMAHEGKCTAVGLTGLPSNVWKAQHRTDLGHSGYYRKISDHRYIFHASKDTWQHIAPLFGCATSKTLPVMQLVEWQAPPAHRQNSVELPVREVSSRLRKLVSKAL